MRYALIRVYALAEAPADGLQLRSLERRSRYVSVPSGEGSHPSRLKLFNDFSGALAAGLGFGGMATLMTYGALLGSATSLEAAFYLDTCPTVSAFVLAGE